MELTLKNYKTVLSPDLLLKAKKGTVRECDEIEKGHYQAYVDENDQTFDTYLLVNPKGEITGHGCDCLSTTSFCPHQTALLLFVLKDKKPVAKLKGAKKVDPLETLVQQADPEKLKAWLLGLLKENKDLGLTFLHQFSQSERQYQPLEIKQLTMDAVKSVIKNKRTVDSAHAKKIVELWAVLHESVIADFCTQTADEESFLRLHAIMEGCETVQSKYGDLNGRISKYEENVLMKVLPAIHQLQDEDTWDKAVNYFTVRIHGAPYYLRSFYLRFLEKLHRLSSIERKRSLTVNLVAQFMKVNARQFYDGTQYIKTVFDLVASSGLFEDYYLLFEPLRYQNDYNVELIEWLIEYDKLALAEKYCLEQIAGNSREDFNGDYLRLLAEIYTIEKDNQKLAGVLKEALSYSFDFNTYLFVDEYLEEGEEKSKWRNKLFTRARREASYHPGAMLFSFQLLDHEHEYVKMLDYLDAGTSYEVIVQFAEKLAATNKDRFLSHMLYRSDDMSDSDLQPEQLQPILEQLFNVFVKRYTQQELMLVVKDFNKKGRYRIPNRFVSFMMNKLVVEV